MNDYENFETIKAGDYVAIRRSHYGSGSYLFKVLVERVTGTQIVLANGAKYRKSNGTKIGADMWDREAREIYILTEDIIKKVEEDDKKYSIVRKREKILTALSAVNFNKCSTETLEKIAGILTENKTI